MASAKQIAKRITVQTKKVKSAINQKHKAGFDVTRERRKLASLQRDFERVTRWDYVGKKLKKRRKK